ncbi:MAG: hypothetical protein PVI26_01155 [Chitinispirillia bacterium]
MTNNERLHNNEDDIQDECEYCGHIGEHSQDCFLYQDQDEFDIDFNELND